MKSTSKNIAKAKYVVETQCENGNIFLHGPFNSKSKAEEYVKTCEEDDRANRVVKGHNPISTHKVRVIMHPTKWTKSVK
jgi:hypothetical protein